MLLPYLEKIPEGYSEDLYKGVKYGIAKVTSLQDLSFKIYAKELGGNDFISLNYYITSQNELLKPCEMPEVKVVDFLKNVVLL